MAATFNRLVSAFELMQGTSVEGLRSGFEFLIAEKAQEPSPARFKIQVNFGRKRSSRPEALNVGVVTFWLSGSRLHGGGDEMVYLCSETDFGSNEYVDFQVGHSTGGQGCGAYILPEFIRGGMALCPKCERLIDAKKLTAQVYFRCTNRNLARGLVRYFRLFDHDVDVVLRYAEDDIRYLVVERLLGSEAARRTRGALVYTLARVIKDVSGGSTLEDRFYAMVSA